jgi:hypothetical protein
MGQNAKIQVSAKMIHMIHIIHNLKLSNQYSITSSSINISTSHPIIYHGIDDNAYYAMIFPCKIWKFALYLLKAKILSLYKLCQWQM